MGELTFTLTMVSRLQRRGIRCVAFTTAREAEVRPGGSKHSRFRFFRFRDYPQFRP